MFLYVLVSSPYLILHILSLDSIYLERFMLFNHANFGTEDHLFVYPASCDNAFQYIHPENHSNFIYLLSDGQEKFSKTIQGKQLVAYIKKADKVIFHGLFQPLIKHLLLLEDFGPKLHWVVWGGDLFSFLPACVQYSELTLSIFKPHVFAEESVQLFFNAAKKMNFILATVKPIVDLTQEYINDQLVGKEFIYPIDKLNDTVLMQSPPPIIAELRKKYDFLVIVGNSADPKNNHSDVFEILKHYKGNFCAIVPLSYGDPVYREKIIAYGNKELKNRFYPITEFFSFDRFTALLNSVDIGIYNHYVTCGSGNLRALLKMNKKIYISPMRMDKDTYLKKGIHLYQLDSHIPEEEFFHIDPIKMQHNKEIFLNTFGNEMAKSYLSALYSQ